MALKVAMHNWMRPEPIETTIRRLARFGARVVLQHGSFRHIGALATRAGVEHASAVLLDLGFSSYQIDESGRGFSFQGGEPLDMRFDPTEGATAAELLGRLPAEEIAGLLAEYGEERHARRIARALVEQRRRAPLSTTADLVSVVKRAVPRAAWSKRTHVATRTFQALRLYLNEELDELANGLSAAERLLRAGGHLAVVTFHSLEDRIAKRFFASRSAPPPRASRHLPEAAGEIIAPSFRLLNRRPLEPSKAEIRRNPRARSARLRAAERTEGPAHPLDLAALGVPRLGFCM